MLHIGSGSVMPAVPLVSECQLMADELEQEQEGDRDDHERVAARAHRDHAQQRGEQPATTPPTGTHTERDVGHAVARIASV